MTSSGARIAADTVLLDVDGTLVDTNYQHALAWFRAFRHFDLTVPLWRIHRGIGMGGDQFVAAVTDDDTERRIGDGLREAWVDEFDSMISEIQPLEGARELMAEVKDRGYNLVLASSGKKHHVEHFLDLIGGRDLADNWTTSDDVERTKPEPDLISVALEQAGGGRGVLVGDSPFDCIAAGKVDVPVLGVRTGGFAAEELRTAGAAHVFDSLVELRERLDDVGLVRRSQT